MRCTFSAVVHSAHLSAIVMCSQTWSNLADTLVKRAELLQEAGDAEACVGSVYGQAMAAYAKACSLSSSEDGDDLPGLLHNWGVGLHSLGTHARVIHSYSLLA